MTLSIDQSKLVFQAGEPIELHRDGSDVEGRPGAARGTVQARRRDRPDARRLQRADPLRVGRERSRPGARERGGSAGLGARAVGRPRRLPGDERRRVLRAGRGGRERPARSSSSATRSRTASCASSSRRCPSASRATTSSSGRSTSSPKDGHRGPVAARRGVHPSEPARGPTATSSSSRASGRSGRGDRCRSRTCLPDFVVFDEDVTPARGGLLLGAGTPRVGGFFTNDWALPALP